MTARVLSISTNNEAIQLIQSVIPVEVVVLESWEKANTLTHIQWDVIFLDLSLKEGNGLDMLAEIKKSDSMAEVIVFGNTNSAEKCVQAMRLGAYSYIEQPFKRTTLKTLLQSILDQGENFKKIEGIAHDAFLDNIDDRMTLLKELIQIRRDKGDFVRPDEFGAFFPIHQRKDENTLEALKTCLGEHDFQKLKKLPPPVILIVDDEPNVRETVSQILNSYRFDTLEAGDAQQALELAKENDIIDLKLLDIGLPGMTGLELLPLLNDIHPDSETIMLTAYKDQVDFIVTSFKNNAFDYITKPYDRNDLLVKISKALQKRAFKKILPDIGNKLLNRSLSVASKIRILNDIATKRIARNRHLLMRDIYLFFPELEESKIPKTKALTEEIISDGIQLFINMLVEEVHKGNDCRGFVDEWETYFEDGD